MLRSKRKKTPSIHDETDNTDLNMSLNESLNLDERNKKRAMSLQILDGNIRISCGSGRASPNFVEENEIEDYLDENSDDNIINGDSTDIDPRRSDSLSLSSALDLDGHDSEATDSMSDSKSLNSRDEVEVENSHNSEITETLSSDDKRNEPASDKTSNENADSEIRNGAEFISSEIGEFVNEELQPDKCSSPSNTPMHSAVNNRHGRYFEDEGLIKIKVDDKTRNIIVDEQSNSQEEKDTQNSKPTENKTSTPKTESNTEKIDRPASHSRLINDSKHSRKRGTSESSRRPPVSEQQSCDRIISRTDSLESSRVLSSDDVESEEDFLQRYFEAEISRLCERLEGEPPSQNIIKCLVSLTTPRDLLSVAACEQPAFVEFDMSYDGFGYLFIPSIAPMGTPGNFHA